MRTHALFHASLRQQQQRQRTQPVPVPFFAVIEHDELWRSVNMSAKGGCLGNVRT